MTEKIEWIRKMDKILSLFPVILMVYIFRMPKFVAARFCEGGHYCSLPRECCTQGCCPPYQSGPRQLPPPSEHVLNLFFISHWFFWCVVVAIILAILCAYSLWKKRRTLCGWGLSEHHTQSEGDSAGSCYAPPQYSRCNSFHHPPPPYTEVTSKPDLYPLVFTCNSDNGKTGSSYLMVQYFRNYIVRPVGSLSAASTVDSLSSSFICNINEANTLVPPPYSRAASPETGFSSHFQQQFMMPRSASQLMYAIGPNVESNITVAQDLSNGSGATNIVQSDQNRTPHYKVVSLNGTVGRNNSDCGDSPIAYNTILQASVSAHFQDRPNFGENNQNHATRQNENYSDNVNDNDIGNNSSSGCGYIKNDNSSISDIFINNDLTSAITTTTNQIGSKSMDIGDFDLAIKNSASLTSPIRVYSSHSQLCSHGTPVIYSNGCIKPNPSQHDNTNPTRFAMRSTIQNSISNSYDSDSGLPLTVPVCGDQPSDTGVKNFNLLRRSLETCCHILQQQDHRQQIQQRPHGQQKQNSINGTESPPSRLNDLINKYTEEGLRSHVTPGNYSAVSSLTNICTPSSPPQAISPTGEVKEILFQIRQLQQGIGHDGMMPYMVPALNHKLYSTKSTSAAIAKVPSINSRHQLQRNSITNCERESSLNAISPTNSTLSERMPPLATPYADATLSTIIPTTTSQSTLTSTKNKENNLKRPSTLQHNTKKLFSPKPNRALYIPMIPNLISTPSSRCILKSPVSSVVGTNLFAGRSSRARKIWISRSAPPTPGSALPPNRLSDNSPLLAEHEEDPEADQIGDTE